MIRAAKVINGPPVLQLKINIEVHINKHVVKYYSMPAGFDSAPDSHCRMYGIQKLNQNKQRNTSIFQVS
jgi:hypothetical protein